MEPDNLAEDLMWLREKLQEEMLEREEAKGTLQSFRQDADSASVARLDLGCKVESLQEEIAFGRNSTMRKSRSSRPRFRRSTSKLMWMFPSLTSLQP